MQVTTLFLDVGGVLLSDGWGKQSQLLASKSFHLDLDEMERRHREIFAIYETGKISLKEYLNRIVFYKKRPFTQSSFEKFMFKQSKPFSKMIELAIEIKKRYGLKIVVVSNEGRELNEYRIKKFKLDHFVDFFISSSIVHLRKPDKDIYRLALGTAHVSPAEVVYIENTPMFAKIAEELQINTIVHSDYESTCAKLSAMKINI